MAGSVNKVILVGNLGRDPEIRTMQSSGDKIANLRIATSETWRDKSTGEKKEKTEWHSVAIFNQGIVGFVEQYASKGSKVYVEGRLETRKWTDQQGQDRYTTEVVIRPYGGELVLLSDGRGGGERRSSGGGGGTDEYGFSTENGRQDARGNARPGGDFDHNFDEEIPFIRTGGLF